MSVGGALAVPSPVAQADENANRPTRMAVGRDRGMDGTAGGPAQERLSCWRATASTMGTAPGHATTAADVQAPWRPGGRSRCHAAAPAAGRDRAAGAARADH